jgi:hypothetical protein
VQQQFQHHQLALQQQQQRMQALQDQVESFRALTKEVVCCLLNFDLFCSTLVCFSCLAGKRCWD